MIFGTNAFNKDLAIYLVQNKDQLREHICKDIDQKDDPFAFLQKFINLSKNNSYVSIQYEQKKGRGRYYTKPSFSLQMMNGIIRNTICLDEDGLPMYEDLDMVLAFPTILLKLAKDQQLPTTYLHKYVYGDLMDTMINLTSKSRKDIKQSVNVLIHSDHNMDIHLKKVPFWNDFKLEVRNIVKNVCICHKDIFKKYKYGENPYGKTIADILQNIESNINLTVQYYLKDDLQIIYKDYGEYTFDGMMIFKPKKDRSSTIITDDLLNDINTYTFDNTGFPIQWKVKPMNVNIIPFPNDYASLIDRPIYVIDDVDACYKFIQLKKNYIKKSKGIHYILVDGIWITCKSKDQFISNIINMLKVLDLFLVKENSKGDTEYIPYRKYVKNLENCAKLVFYDNSYADHNFDDTLFRSNLGYIAFNNGIYHFQSKQFLPFHNLPEICFQTKLFIDFPPRVDKDIDEVYSKLYSIFPLLPNDTILDPNGNVIQDRLQMFYFLNYVSRSLAGCLNDKIWAVCVGLRNSGKGVLCELIKNTLGDFVKSTNAENYCIRRKNGDTAKSNSWMSRFIYRRIGISNEIPDQSTLDSTLIKSWASGGDSLEMRTNHVDEYDSKIQAKSIINCNVLPKCDRNDCKETCIVFNFRKKFIPYDEYQQKLNDGIDMTIYDIADDTIKDWCNLPYVKYAFLHILFDHFTEDFVCKTPKGIVLEDTNAYQFIDDKPDTLELIQKYFLISNDHTDRVKGTDITKHKNHFDDTKFLSFIDLKTKLLLLGAHYKPKLKVDGVVTSGFTNIKLITPPSS